MPRLQRGEVRAVDIRVVVLRETTTCPLVTTGHWAVVDHVQCISVPSSPRIAVSALATRCQIRFRLSRGQMQGRCRGDCGHDFDWSSPVWLIGHRGVQQCSTSHCTMVWTVEDTHPPTPPSVLARACAASSSCNPYTSDAQLGEGRSAGSVIHS
jgi:hypothetical protein